MNTVIKLYSCWKCGRIKDQSDVSKPTSCKCGSRMVRPAEPTRKNIALYFIGHPSKLLLWAKERLCA